MRHLKYLPLAFLAGPHGFAMLAPYLAFCATMHAVFGQHRQLPVVKAAVVTAIAPNQV